jgi:hypothetical protein
MEKTARRVEGIASVMHSTKCFRGSDLSKVWQDLCAWGEKIKKMTLQGLEEKTTCPLLNISTSGEGKYMYNHAKAFFDKLSNPQMVMDPRADSSS